MTSLKIQTFKGIIWNFSELVLRRGASGLTTIVLAWFLVPEDFGLVAMMAVFLAFSRVIVDAGLSQALIRKKAISSLQLDTIFFSNIILAIVLYSCLYLSAPIIAKFYDEEKLIELIRVSGITVIFSAFSVVQQAILSRELKFKLQMQVTLPSTFLSGVIAIGLAYYGVGVWALVAQMLIQTFCVALFYWQLDFWRPKLQFSWLEFTDLFSFGGYLLMAQIINVLFKHMYVIVIAKLFSVPLAGFYFFAERIRDLVVEQMVASIQTVTYPSLSRVQSEPKRLKNGYRQVISVMTFLLFPTLIFTAALAENIFHFILPEVWLPAALYLQLMCLAGLLYPLNSTNLNILKVKGRADLVFYIAIAKKAVAIIIFFFSLKFGIFGILVGQIVNSMVAYLPNSFYSKKLIDYTVYEQLSDFMPSLILAGIIGCCLYWLQEELYWTAISELLVLGLSGVFIYLLGAWMLNLYAFELATDLIKDRIKGSEV